MAEQSRRAMVFIALLALLGALVVRPAAATLGEEPGPGETITQYLTADILPVVFPGAEKIGVIEGTPPAAPVYRGGKGHEHASEGTRGKTA